MMYLLNSAQYSCFLKYPSSDLWHIYLYSFLINFFLSFIIYICIFKNIQPNSALSRFLRFFFCFINVRFRYNSLSQTHCKNNPLELPLPQFSFIKSIFLIPFRYLFHLKDAFSSFVRTNSCSTLCFDEYWKTHSWIPLQCSHVHSWLFPFWNNGAKLYGHT